MERRLAPDATTTLGFMLERCTGLVEGLVVYPENMKRNLDRSGSLFFSEAILLALIGKGLGRQEAYVLVQRNAMKTFQGEGVFRALLGQDPDVSQRLSAAELDEAFDLEHSLRFAEQIVDRAIRA